MKIPKFTDQQLEDYVENTDRSMTSLERQLAATLMQNRASLRLLRDEIEPIAKQIISPKDNTFSRQLKLINDLLQ